MPEPNNPFDDPGEPLTEIPPEGYPVLPSPDAFPAWSGRDLIFVVAVLLGVLFVADMAAVSLAELMSGLPRSQVRTLAADPRVVVPAQGVAYLITVGFIARLIRRYYRSRFFEAVHWRFPDNWLKFLAGGMLLAVVIQALSAALPIPKQMPIDQLFQTTSGAWMMAGFGTLVAPFCEELFFRGLLFPVLRNRLGVVVAIALTSFFFAFIHASQLAHAWAAVSMLFIVGVALTVVRARAHSLAASVLVHIGYNLALFALLYTSTAGFHNFHRFGQ